MMKRSSPVELRRQYWKNKQPEKNNEKDIVNEIFFQKKRN